MNPKLTPTITGTASPNPAAAGQQVSIGAILSYPSGSPAPAGTVTFHSGSTAIGTVPISVVVASSSVGAVLKITASANGTYPLTATYNGDVTYNPVTFAPFTLTVGTIVF